MAPKRSRKRMVGVVRSTRKFVKETVWAALVEGDAQESTQEDINLAETEEIDVVVPEEIVRTAPVEEKKREGEDRTVEVSVEDPNLEREKDAGDGRKGLEELAKDEGRKEESIAVSRVSQEQAPSREEERKEDPTSAEVSQEDPSSEEEKEERPSKKAKTEQEGKETTGRPKGTTPTQEGKGKNERRRKRRRSRAEGGEGYRRYVFRVLKQVHPELRISSMAMSVINNLMMDMFERIAEEAAKLSQYAHRTTLSSREIQDAVRLVLPGDLGKHAIAEGSKALSNYVSYEKKSGR